MHLHEFVEVPIPGRVADPTAHPLMLESVACQFNRGWDSSPHGTPPRHQPRLAVWWEYPAVKMGTERRLVTTRS